jgi:hypothetical protein
MEEPSVLDYVKSKLFFWRKTRIQIPKEGGIYPQTGTQDLSTQPAPEDKPLVLDEHPEAAEQSWYLFPPGSGWVITRLVVAILIILSAQRAFEPPGRSLALGVVLYLVGVGLFVWSNLRGEWQLPKQPVINEDSPLLTIKWIGLFIGIPLGLLAFLMFGNNQFTAANLIVWGFAFSAFMVAFWIPESMVSTWLQRVRDAWSRFTSRGITFSPWTLLVLAVFGFTAFYRFYLLDQVPAEMFSDHAEKLIDVGNVLEGQTNIFFPRNTGREAFQMYLTAFMIVVFKTGLSFLSLKLGTALCGLFALPFIYLLGNEVANRRVGLFAMFFAGIAYWPNVISRVALRFTLYPTFTAPMLFFLIRGLKRRKRNDFILSGIFLGLGLYGYSPFRFVPMLVVVTIVFYLLHRGSKGAHGLAIWGLFVIGLTSFLIFTPLLRYIISNPGIFGYRMMSRIGQVERAYPGPPFQIFLENSWKALTMFVWDNGQIWVHSIPNRPALGIVTAGLTVIGVVLLVVRYIKEKDWLDITLLVSIPLLMMPSILSLAFPDENPSLNRTGGALVVVFLISAMAFDGILTAFRSNRLGAGGKWLAWIVGGILLTGSAGQNYDLVFNQYAQQFKTNAWNTSELGAVIRQFADSSGAEDSAWVIPYPHWVDTRLVGIRAGFPERDYALWPENIIETVNDPRPKLYLVKPEDTETIDLLQMLYPNGVLRLYDSKVVGRDFYMYSVPPVQ